MAFDTRRTYLCYNNKDLIRDGFIPVFIEKEYIPVSSFNINRLKNPPKGVVFIIERDPETQEIISVIERKKLLPADKMKIEFDFSKVMKNAVSHPIAPGTLSFSPLANMIATPLLAPIGFGGITSGFTNITFQVLETRTKINQAITVTEETINTGILEFDGYPLSIFGIVKEHLIDIPAEMTTEEFKSLYPEARVVSTPTGERIGKIGLNFKAGQRDVLGKFSSGMWKGTARKRISGATDSSGLFGGAADPELKIVENTGDSGEGEEVEVVLFPDQKQLFQTIVYDNRKLKFRGDNYDALGAGEYPYKINGTSGLDATDKQIRIDTTDLHVDDVIYITYLITVGDRHLRQNLQHKGTVAQGNTIGIVGFVGAIGSETDAFDYRLRTWKVPPLPPNYPYSQIDQITNFYTQDDDYKLTLDEFINIDGQQRRASENFELNSVASEIEGWRLSEAILWRDLDKFFAADWRGILYFNNNSVTILYPRSAIWDQKWFTSYLESLPFTSPTGNPDPDDPVDEAGTPKFTYLESDLQKNIEDYIDLDDQPGFLFDTSEIVNSLLFDREKTHYYRPFANALKDVSKYREVDGENQGTGIGIINLDLLPLVCDSISVVETTEIVKGETITRRTYNFTNYDYFSCDFSGLDLNYYDLSFGVFDHITATPTKIMGCEEDFDIINYHYFGTNYDAMNEGPGAWLDRGFIEDQVFEWRPSGSSIESYWKLETPYYCSDFSSDSHVYAEKMGGNSLDNYSWIYVDTASFAPQNISADASFNSEEFMVTFTESNVHDSICFHKVNTNTFENDLTLVKIDKTKTHVRDTYQNNVNGQTVTEFYNHDENMVVGQNRLLGDTPSYAHGIPVTDEIFKISKMEEDISNIFWGTYNLLTDLWPDGTSFDLNMGDDPPRANIPFYWNVDYIEVKFTHYGADLEELQKYISFYFEETETSISNYKISQINIYNSEITFRISFKYYLGGPIHFLGEFWKRVNILEVNARFASSLATSQEQYNIDNYKIDSSQSAVVYDEMNRIIVFYSNEETSNIDAAISSDNGLTWIYYKSLIRLLASETATLPFIIKDNEAEVVHLFYILNDAFLMYKKIDTNLMRNSNDALVEHDAPETYEPGDYDLTQQDPEREYWGNYSEDGVILRREPSYFVAGSSQDQYFIENKDNIEGIDTYNESLTNAEQNQKQTHRFLFVGDEDEMIAVFKAEPYAVYLSDDGTFRLFFVSNGKLSIKRSDDYVTWKYDIIEQVIHKNYVNDEINKGFPEEISNIQIIRNDYDKSTVSLLYVNNRMLFLRNFSTSRLSGLVDSDGNFHNEDIINHLELTDDFDADPPKERSTNLPIFLVGIIPDSIKTTLKNEIDDEIEISESELFVYFPYKDPDTPTDKKANKEMVDRFDEKFEVDTNTQPYGIMTATGITRIFYKDQFGNIDGIILNSHFEPVLEVMNVFKKA